MKQGIGTKWNRDERGLTLLEYAAGAAFVLAIAIAAFTALGGNMNTFFTAIGTQLTNITTTTSN